jgi:L-lactate dehydrogenase complex protein LldE
MLADKMAAVRATGAEVVTAGDASCLMHIGGGLSRLRTGVPAVHLAEVLASTEGAGEHLPRYAAWPRPRAGGGPRGGPPRG